MRNRLRFALGRLASIEYQRRFCVGATKDCYVLPKEILYSATNAVEVTFAQPVVSKRYSCAELDVLRKLLEDANDALGAIPYELLSWRELIEDNADWNKLRMAAQECLSGLQLKVSWEELLSRS